MSVAVAYAQPVSVEVGPGKQPPATPPSLATGSPYGRRIVELRYKPSFLKPTNVALEVGQTLSPANLSAAMNQLAGHLSRHSELVAAASGTGTLSFTYVDAEFDLSPKGNSSNDAVGVTLRPFHLTLPLDEIGGSVLPIPRGLSIKAASPKSARRTCRRT